MRLVERGASKSVRRLAWSGLLCLAGAASALASETTDDFPVSSIASPAVATEGERPIIERRIDIGRIPLVGRRFAIRGVDAASKAPVIVAMRGVELMSFAQVCLGADGARVACGSRAKVELFNFLANASMSCALHEDGAVAPKGCSIGGRDIGEWAVNMGIGRPLRPGEHAEALRQAREAGRGMWADAAAASTTRAQR